MEGGRQIHMVRLLRHAVWLSLLDATQCRSDVGRALDGASRFSLLHARRGAVSLTGQDTPFSYSDYLAWKDARSGMEGYPWDDDARGTAGMESWGDMGEFEQRTVALMRAERQRTPGSVQEFEQATIDLMLAERDRMPDAAPIRDPSFMGSVVPTDLGESVAEEQGQTMDERKALLQKIKDAGLAGIVSYGLVQLAFFGAAVAHRPLRLLSDHRALARPLECGGPGASRCGGVCVPQPVPIAHTSAHRPCTRHGSGRADEDLGQIPQQVEFSYYHCYHM